MKLFKDFGIRALFGTIILGGFLGCTIFSLVYRLEALEKIKDIFMPLAMAVIGFYFGSKIGGKNG